MQFHVVDFERISYGDAARRAGLVVDVTKRKPGRPSITRKSSARHTRLESFDTLDEARAFLRDNQREYPHAYIQFPDHAIQEINQC